MKPVIKPELEQFANHCMNQRVPADQSTQEFAGAYLAELGMQDLKEFDFRFDTAAANQVLSLLVPLQLSQLERLKIWVTFGWLRKSDGTRRYSDNKGF